jgi:cytochrome c oxidase subunit 2
MAAGNVAGNAPQAQPHHLVRVGIIWFVSSVIGIIIVLWGMPHIMPTTASDTADFADLTVIVFTAVAVPVAFFVFAFLGYSVFVFRVKDRPTIDGPRLQPTRLTQIAWLAITGALCLFLLVWGLLGIYEQAVASPSDPLTVKVTAQQWTWTYSYPEYGIETHTLYLPIHRSIRFQVTSSDVLHGFAIDQLGVRMDANPGVVLTLPFTTPNRIGNYETRCVEFCGLYHSYMYTPVKVVSAASFASWVRQQGGHIEGGRVS